VRIVIPVTGCRGDIQPYIGLGKGLQAAGHKVRLATHSDFGPVILQQGLDFVEVAASAQALHTSAAAPRMSGRGVSVFAYLRELVRLREPLMQDLMSRCAAACRDADLVLLTPTALLVGLSAAEKWERPVAIASFVPTAPSRYAANCLFPELPAWVPGRGLYNWLSHRAVGGCLWLFLRPLLNRARREVLDLPPLPLMGPPAAFFEKTLTLAGYSDRVLPRPPDWGSNVHITGYWFLDAPSGWQPPAALQDFLDSGPPPVCIGFGSMSDGDAAQATKAVHQSLAVTGQRAVLLTGWGALQPGAASDRVFVVDQVPHDWLFPRAAAVIHHGGAGATGAALRAGVPSLAVPFAADQFLWGRRLFALGVGARPIPRRRLSAERLSEALRVLTGDAALRRRAAEVGELIRAEDGPGCAARLLAKHGFAPRRPAPPPTRDARAERLQAETRPLTSLTR